jgi:hypothetical protein
MPPERQSRTDIGERNTDEVEMSGAALRSKSYFVDGAHNLSQAIHRAFIVLRCRAD